LSEVPRRLNETRVADYLVPLLEDKEITFYEEIVRLPPAHRIAVTREGVRIDQYWALDPEREIRMKSDAEYADAFREIFTEAVRCRLRSAFPVGSMLSGGLDSSSIVCVARKLLADNGGGRLHTFSAVFDGVPECDERHYIEAVLAQGGLEPHFVRGDLLSPLADLDRILTHQDEPFHAPNLFLHRGLDTAASQSGVRVLLDGIDGDTTVSHGVRYLTELARMGRWTALARDVRGLSKHFNDSWSMILFRFALKPFAPEPIRLAWRALRSRARSTEGRPTIMRPEFARRIGSEHRTEALLAERLTTPMTAREDHWRSLTRGLIPLVLEMVDRAAAAVAIDCRFPFFD